MKTYGLLLVAALVGFLTFQPPVSAASVSMELFVLIPHRHELAVYQQMVLDHPGLVTTVDVAAGHTAVAPINFKASSIIGNTVTEVGSASELAMRYTVPWNGISKLITVTEAVPATAVVVMVPSKSLTLPNVLNPIWEVLSARKIPGLPDSPNFSVWATGKVRAGQSIAFSLERIGGAEAGAVSTFEPQGFPTAAALMTLLLGLVLLVSVLAVVNWKPSAPRVNPQKRDELMAQLAQLEAHYRQGGLEQPLYEAQRQDMLAELARQWGA